MVDTTEGASVAAQTADSVEQPTPQVSQQVDSTPAQVGDSRYIQVPAEQLTPWGGRYGDALTDARFGRQAREQGVEEFLGFLSQQGMTTRELLDYWRSQPPEVQAQPEAQAAMAQATGAAIDNRTGAEQPLTAEAITKLLDERDQKAREESEKAEASRTEKEARDAEGQFGVQVLQEIGLKHGSTNWTIAGRTFNGCINDALAESIPQWAHAEQRAEAMSAPATPKILERAKELFIKSWADFQNEIIAAHASGQLKLPAATLGAGAGGRPPTKPYDQMTSQEQKAYRIEAVKARRPA